MSGWYNWFGHDRTLSIGRAASIPDERITQEGRSKTVTERDLNGITYMGSPGAKFEIQRCDSSNQRTLVDINAAMLRFAKQQEDIQNNLKRLKELEERIDEVYEIKEDLLNLAELAGGDREEITKRKDGGQHPSLHEHDPGDSARPSQELQIQNPTWSLPG